MTQEQTARRDATEATKRQLRTILGAMPTGESALDPRADPHRQPVRLALAAAARGRVLHDPRPRWDLLRRLQWPAPGLPADVDLPSLAATACGPIRYEIDNRFAEHRPYPSPRSRFPVRVAVSERGDDTRLFVPEADAFLPVPLDTALPAGTVETCAIPSALPDFYGPLRPVLTALETGHVLASLALIGQALGRPLEVAGPASRPWTAWLARQVPDVVPGYRMTDAASAVERPLGAARRSWAETVWLRNGGRAPKGATGFSAARTPVSGDVWRDALHILRHADPGLGTLRPARTVLHLYCWVRDVHGVGDGLYAVDSDGAAVQVGDLAAADVGLAVNVAPLRSLVFDVHKCSLVWMFVADLERATTRGSDPQAIADDVLAAAGWLAQHLSLAAAAHGLFARPLRNYVGERAAAALALPDDRQVMYQLACGVERFTEPGLDVRPSGSRGDHT
ncbi:hypothetical protein [Streptomyces sp. NPDC054834]